MSHRDGENGNQRRTREAFEKLVDSPPEVIEAGNRNVERWRWWIVRYARDFRKAHRRHLVGVPLDELVGAAGFGMVKASRTWTESEGAFSGWAWYYMRKEMQKLIRSEANGCVPLLEDGRGNVVEVVDSASGPAEEAEAAELVSRVGNVVEVLPEALREAFRDWRDGHPASYTADRLGTSTRAVYRDRWMAVERIKAGLMEDPGGTSGSPSQGA
jgi:RNA polymerase sigma factor (sigma-70 family)